MNALALRVAAFFFGVLAVCLVGVAYASAAPRDDRSPIVYLDDWTTVYLIALVHAVDEDRNRGVGMIVDKESCAAAAPIVESNYGGEWTAHCIPVKCFGPKAKALLDRPKKRRYVIPCSALVVPFDREVRRANTNQRRK